ncbi:3-hydroxyisobutyryl-CoA hydrolase 1 isoform X2 [Nicotiana tabacum]|uniref:3-hydroxyisobutyryl-CoA hydrolase n=1 Tax=Nicotiana tabacum TaxID=4097 RepID=A0A1S4AU97_TOBAC|nr:PREDICTED: 3-hydroxyisobutyryl-CoA hydrolase 1-like isoform X2 [Nicotiana tabacum]
MSDYLTQIKYSKWSQIHYGCYQIWLSFTRLPSLMESSWEAGLVFLYVVDFELQQKSQVFSMPEIALGFFPDIGASYCLSRLPGFFGEYAGHTGSRLDCAEMLACGLATHFVSSAGR